MKTHNRFVIVAAVLIFALGCGTIANNIKVFSAKTYQLRPYKELILPNGLKILLVPDNSLPSFSIEMLVKSGSTDDPPDQPGVAELVANLLDQGTTHRSASEIADSFGQLGTQWNAQVNKDFTLISTSGLSQYQNQIMKDFFEIITEPSFSEAELTRARNRNLAELRQLVDSPERFSEEVLDPYLYGDAHPYGRRTRGTISSMKSIRRKHIIKYFLSFYRPNNSYIAVVGQFKDGIENDIARLTQNWAPKEIKLTAIPAFPATPGIKIRLIEKSDLKQAQIYFGQPGIRRVDPDFLTLRLADTILGNPHSLSSRLAQEIRIKRSLTYGISSDFEARQGQGPFLIETSTRMEKIHDMVVETLNVVRDFHDKGVTDEEVESAKSFLKGKFPRSMETPERFSDMLLVLRYYGIPDDYLRNYLDNLDAISTREVNRVIAKFFNPESMRIQVYAPREAALKQLKEVAPTEEKSFQDFL